MHVPVGVDQVVGRDVADEQAHERPAEDDQHRGPREPSHGACIELMSCIGAADAPGMAAPSREWVVISSSRSSTEEPGSGSTGVMLVPLASVTVRTRLSTLSP